MDRNLKPVAWLPLVVFVATMVLIGHESSTWVFQPPAFVLELYVAFVAPVSLAIAVLAARSYRVRGDPDILWVGCGALIWAFASPLAFVLIPRSLNSGVTVHNSLAWLSAACHLIGVFMFRRRPQPASGTTTRLWIAYGAAVAAVALVTATASAELTPTFFGADDRSTPLRQVVLLSGSLMFVFAASLLFRESHGIRDTFAYWYSLALLLIAAGLAAVLIQASPRSLMGWIGRTAQLVGTVYMLIAVFVAARSSRGQGQRMAIALREVAEQFDNLFDMAGDGVVMHELVTLSNPGRFLRANHAFCALLGCTAQEMSRLSPTDIIAPEDREHVRVETENLIRDGRVRSAKTLIARDGRRILVEINSRLFQRNGHDFVVSIIRDIGERILAEEQRAQLAAIVENSEDAIVAETLDGVITSWNRGAVQIFGYCPDEAIGRPASALFPADRVEADLTLHAGLDQSRGVRTFDAVRLRKDGSPIHVAVSISPIRDGAGQVVGVSKIARDITVQKDAEAMLARAKAAAEEASRAKSTFLTNMSHEIRTPMHNIIGLAQQLRREARDPLQRRGLDDLCASSDHLLAVINDVLELSRIDANRLNLENANFTVGAVLDRVYAMIKALADAKGLRLSIHAPPETRRAVLRGDATRLRQVLVNLAGNAVKFSDQGEVSIDVECLEEDAHEVGLRFAVRDSGPGIVAEDRERIFRAFEQVDSSASGGHGGSGLGLAISDGLVRAMGGTISVSNEPDRGSTFAFDLYLARGTVVRETADEQIAENWFFAGSLVLVAEDHPVSRRLLLGMLTDLGCAVDLACDGSEAVEKARSTQYDLILMDIQLPKLDGLAATRAIRDLPQHEHTPILALTASAFAEDRERCLAAGMNGHLAKPVTRVGLAKELSNWLAQSEAAGDGDAPSAAAGDRVSRADSATEGMLSRNLDGMYTRDYTVKEYIRLHESDIVQLPQLLANGNYEEARILLHSIEGASMMVGAKGVGAAAAALAAALRSGAERAHYEILARACEAEFNGLAASVTVPPRGTAASQA